MMSTSCAGKPGRRYRLEGSPIDGLIAHGAVPGPGLTVPCASYPWDATRWNFKSISTVAETMRAWVRFMSTSGALPHGNSSVGHPASWTLDLFTPSVPARYAPQSPEAVAGERAKPYLTSTCISISHLVGRAPVPEPEKPADRACGSACSSSSARSGLVWCKAVRGISRAGRATHRAPARVGTSTVSRRAS